VVQMNAIEQQLVILVNQLIKMGWQSNKLNSHPIADTFMGGFGYCTSELGYNLRESWFGDVTVVKLKGELASDWLPIEIIDDLVGLLLDEFRYSLIQDDIDHVEAIQAQCGQIRALLNQAAGHPPNTRLGSALDCPVVRRKLSFDSDTALCTPVCKMIEGMEQILSNDNLSESQRRDLGIALENTRKLYHILQTARPLIETQNFRALARLSHMYRSPFCGITGWFLLLLKRNNEGLTSPQLDELRNLHFYSRTVGAMANNLLEAAKILSGTQKFQVKMMDFHEHMKYLMSWLEEQKQLHPQLSIQVQMPETLPLVQADPSRLDDSLRFVLDNAFKYTPRGQVCLDIAHCDEWVIFRVQDTGIGIPQDQQARIFQPFTQVGEQSKGLGIGLFLARNYAQSFGGSLAVGSQEGIGSTFILSLPVAQ
jgi:signal transduction histidine kinase